MKVALVNELGQFVKLWSKTAVVYTDNAAQAFAWSHASDRLSREKAKIIKVTGRQHAEISHPDYRFVTVHDGFEILECLSKEQRIVGDHLFSEIKSKPAKVDFMLPGPA